MLLPVAGYLVGAVLVFASLLASAADPAVAIGGGLSAIVVLLLAKTAHEAYRARCVLEELLRQQLLEPQPESAADEVAVVRAGGRRRPRSHTKALTIIITVATVVLGIITCYVAFTRRDLIRLAIEQRSFTVRPPAVDRP